MKEYRNREVVLAEQYFPGKEIEGVKIGRNDPNDRWDDTPDGPYVQGEKHKHRLEPGYWIIKKEESKFLSVMTDAEFQKNYKPKKQKQ